MAGTRIRATLYDRQRPPADPWRRSVLIEVLTQMATRTVRTREVYTPPTARISVYNPRSRGDDQWWPLGGGRIYTLWGTKLYPTGADAHQTLPTIEERYMLQTDGSIEVMPRNDHEFQQWVGSLLVKKLAVRYPLQTQEGQA